MAEGEEEITPGSAPVADPPIPADESVPAPRQEPIPAPEDKGEEVESGAPGPDEDVPPDLDEASVARAAELVRQHPDILEAAIDGSEELKERYRGTEEARAKLATDTAQGRRNDALTEVEDGYRKHMASSPTAESARRYTQQVRDELRKKGEALKSGDATDTDIAPRHLETTYERVASHEVLALQHQEQFLGQSFYNGLMDAFETTGVMQFLTAEQRKALDGDKDTLGVDAFEAGIIIVKAALSAAPKAAVQAADKAADEKVAKAEAVLEITKIFGGNGRKATRGGEPPAGDGRPTPTEYNDATAEQRRKWEEAGVEPIVD